MGRVFSIQEQIGICCEYALLLEVAVSPKPGLVDRLGNGAHRDMDFFTFIDSITAISPYFISFAEIGADLEHIDGTTLDMLRPLGVECENAMFKATNGVNTHKGAIFSLGILSAAAGYCYSSGKGLSAEIVCNAAGSIAKASERDFKLQDESIPGTKGREIYKHYGIRGVRGEAASGFYSVREYALPVMRELSKFELYDRNDIYLQALLHLMANVVDTNVIARSGIEAIEYVKGSARNVLAIGGAMTAKGREELLRMDEEYIKQNISPGGCADLLSAAIMLQLVEKII